MDRIDKIIKATIKEVLLEKVDKRKDVLYHQTGFSVEKIRSILQNGLIPRDNGESNCIWFSVNKPFYNDPRLVTLKVSYNDFFKRNHRFIDDVSRVMVYDIVEPFEIIIDKMPFCIDAENGNPILYTDFKLNPKIQKLYNVNTVAEFINKNKQLNERGIIIFGDVFERFIEKGTLHYFRGNNNIQIEILGI